MEVFEYIEVIVILIGVIGFLLSIREQIFFLEKKKKKKKKKKKFKKKKLKRKKRKKSSKISSPEEVRNILTHLEKLNEDEEE